MIQVVLTRDFLGGSRGASCWLPGGAPGALKGQGGESGEAAAILPSPERPFAPPKKGEPIQKHVRLICAFHMCINMYQKYVRIQLIMDPIDYGSN